MLEVVIGGPCSLRFMLLFYEKLNSSGGLKSFRGALALVVRGSACAGKAFTPRELWLL